MWVTISVVVITLVFVLGARVLRGPGMVVVTVLIVVEGTLLVQSTRCTCKDSGGMIGETSWFFLTLSFFGTHWLSELLRYLKPIGAATVLVLHFVVAVYEVEVEVVVV